jgi:anthranilate phosphoribosyltransferase
MVGYLEKLLRGEDLDEEEAATAMEMIMRGEATPSQIAGFLVALRAKGEAIDEITGFARTALAMATRVDVPGDVQRFHPSFRHAGPTRRELGIRTFFNVLGPICNPAGAAMRAIGVADPELVEPVIQVLARIGVRRVLVFHGAGGMDELSTTGVSSVVEVLEGRRRRYPLDPSDLGLQPATARDVRGGSPKHNAEIARALLQGEPGPKREILLLNAAAALRAAGIASEWRDGIALAEEAIDDGRAARVLDHWVRVSGEAAA